MAGILISFTHLFVKFWPYLVFVAYKSYENLSSFFEKLVKYVLKIDTCPVPCCPVDWLVPSRPARPISRDGTGLTGRDTPLVITSAIFGQLQNKLTSAAN